MKYLSKTVSLSLNAEICTGCGRCMEVCPHCVFRMENKKAVIQDRDLCMECGACEKNCEFGAVRVLSGVGCAQAVLRGKLKGSDPSCGCSDSGETCCV
jgi:NAD-dependent dihydropyrimidine dehydrogenase PreA subunit